MTTTMESIIAKKSSFWAVTLLVSGTCIGGGMLALPIQTAQSGFFMSLMGILICWAFMTYSGLLLIEATTWVKNETHFSSLSRILLGNKVRLLSIIIYLFMNYASLVAYTAGGGALIANWVQVVMGITLSYHVSCLIFTLIFGSLIYLGAVFIGKLNLLFMMGLAVCYVLLFNFGIHAVKPELLVFRPDWRAGAGIFSMILATFSYQMVIPNLCGQLNYDTKKLKKALIIGTSIPCMIYSLWVLVIHGVIPLEGQNGLLDAWERGASATEPLRAHLNHWALTILADFFAFFAIVTSYLGLSLALFSFLKDCFNELKFKINRHGIILFSILPTLILAILFPRALLKFLDLSGAYGDTILSGLIPIGMVWVGRYRKNMMGDMRVFGGKLGLQLAAGFYLFVIFLQWI